MLRHATLILAISIAWPLAAQKRAATAHRHAPDELELVSAALSGAQRPSVYLSRAYLSTLPQATATLEPDDDFPEGSLSRTSVGGVDLEVLLHSIAPAEPNAALFAICRDGYTSPFPRTAILDHHPILVLTIDGLTPHAWSVKHHAYNPGAYFVSYPTFVPSFHLLAHEDFPQRPAEIVRLKIVSSAQLFTAIKPLAIDQLPKDSPVVTGFHIAQQNCIRCHNAGDTGGTKAQRTWQHLAKVARSRPQYFAKWVHNPQSIDPQAKMPPNLKYDQSTLDALTRYFQAFTH